VTLPVGWTVLAAAQAFDRLLVDLSIEALWQPEYFGLEPTEISIQSRRV
jgi:hypothetical protein